MCLFQITVIYNNLLGKTTLGISWQAMHVHIKMCPWNVCTSYLHIFLHIHMQIIQFSSSHICTYILRKCDTTSQKILQALHIANYFHKQAQRNEDNKFWEYVSRSINWINPLLYMNATNLNELNKAVNKTCIDSSRPLNLHPITWNPISYQCDVSSWISLYLLLCGYIIYQLTKIKPLLSTRKK